MRRAAFDRLDAVHQQVREHLLDLHGIGEQACVGIDLAFDANVARSGFRRDQEQRRVHGVRRREVDALRRRLADEAADLAADLRRIARPPGSLGDRGSGFGDVGPSRSSQRNAASADEPTADSGWLTSCSIDADISANSDTRAARAASARNTASLSLFSFDSVTSNA